MKKKDKLAEMLAARRAPLVEADINELGDKRLDPIESVASQREKALQQASQYKIAKQEELEDQNRSLGPRLQYTELISRLKRAIPALKVMDGSPGNIALYFPRDRKELEEATNNWDYLEGKDTFFLQYKYVGGFPKAEIPEYSTIDIDTSHLPTKEHRGWRSVLITLLKAGAVPYEKLLKEFGDVGTDKRGWRWQDQTAKWRSNPTAQFTSSNL